jgi:hypothetical protein
MALRFSSSNQRGGCLTGRAPARMSSECPAASLGMSRMSEGFREDVGVRAEKVGEHCFLFGIEPGADPDLLGGVAAGVEEDDLNRLRWLKVAGMTLHIWHLL